MQEQPTEVEIANETVSTETTQGANNLETSNEALKLNSLALQHPIFKFEEDDLLRGLVLLLRNLPKPQDLRDITTAFGDLIFRQIFNSKPIEELIDELQELGLSNKRECLKEIKAGDVCFRCLDCEINENPNFYFVICAECFEKSNHHNHRVIFISQTEANGLSCICGETSIFKAEGTCPDHHKSQMPTEEILNKLPKEIIENSDILFSKAIYGALSIYEIANSAQGEPCYESVMSLAKGISDEIFTLALKMTENINSSFYAVFQSIFRNPLKEPFNVLWHDCDDLSGELVNFKEDNIKPHGCKCSILGNLFRLGKGLETGEDLKVNNLLSQLAREPFKQFFSKEFTRHLKFLIPQAFRENSMISGGNSKMLDWNNFIWSDDELYLIALENNCIQQFTDILKTSIVNYSKLTIGLIESVSFLGDTWSFVLNSQKPELSQKCLKIMQEANTFSKLVEQTQTVQLKHLYEKDKLYVGIYDHKVDYTDLGNIYLVTECILLGLTQGARLISNSPPEERLEHLKTITKDWFDVFQATETIQRLEFEKNSLNVNPVVARIFLILLRAYESEISQDNFHRFLNEFFDEKQKGYLAEKLVSSLIESLGAMRYLLTVHHPDAQPLNISYTNLNWLIFETDIISIQLLSSLIPAQNLFENLVAHFFSYDKTIQENYKDPISFNNNPDHQKKRILVLQDFLNFLVFIMNDEISLISMKQTDNTIQVKKEKGSTDPHLERILERVIVNVLLTQYWTDVSHVKSILLSLFFSIDDVEKIISKVSVYDNKSHKIRIKDGYEPDFDPYLFYRLPSMQESVINEITTKDHSTKKIDLISGKFYQDQPKHLTTLQRHFYQSSLPEYLSSLLKQKFTKETSYLTRSLLRLVLLNLQVVEEAWDELESKIENEALRKKVEQNYMNEEFSNSLNKLSKEDIIEDCKPCIKKIQNMIISLASKFQEDSDLPAELTFLKKQSSHFEDKKKIAKEKMERMKEEFAKKQALFAEKQKELSPTKEIGDEEKIIESETEKADLTCQYCLEKIDKVRDEYGVPIYVAFTNNFYDVNTPDEGFSEIDYSQLTVYPWWPVVSSCNHHYHKNCFDILYCLEDGYKMFQHNRLETYCSLCKTSCNNFLCLNKGENSAVRKEVSSQEKQAFPEIHFSFSQKVQGVLYYNRIFFQSLSSKKPLDPSSYTYISKDIIFSRATYYFFESFYLHKDIQAKKDGFELYSHFFRNFISDCKPADNQQSGWSYLEGVMFSLPKYDALVMFLTVSIDLFLEQHFTEDIRGAALSKKIGAVDEEILRKANLNFLEELFGFLILKQLTLDKINNVFSGSFEEQISLLSDNINLFQPYLNELIFSLQKVMLMIAMTQNILLEKPPVLPNNFFKLLFAPNSTLETINQTLVHIGITSTITEILKQSFKDMNANLKSKKLFTEIIVPGLFLPNLTALSGMKVKYNKRAPKMITLPQTYAEYNNTYLRKKCKLCNKFCNHTYTFACFICGEVFCQGYCPSIHEPPERQKGPCTKCNGQCPPRHEIVGNLNRHAAKYHMGMGFFLDIFQPFTNVIFSPLNAISPSKNIYIDDLGQPIQLALDDLPNLKEIDFTKFRLNPEFEEEVEDVVMNHKIGKECFKVMIGYPPEDQIPPPYEL